MAVWGSRCCGEEGTGCTCKPSVAGARDLTARRRLATLSAMCVLVLTAHVAPAEAEDVPEPPLLPAVPTVAVQVSVSVPGVTVNVQAGTVDVSVSTASVDVSVSVSSESISAGTETVDVPSEQVAAATPSRSPPRAAAAKASPAPRAVSAARHPRPLRAKARLVAAPTVRRPDVARSRHLLAAKPAARSARARRAAPKARRGCCVRTGPVAGAAAARPLPRVWSRPDPFGAPQLQRVGPVGEPVRDNRLLLQVGVLGAFLYLVCLAGWFSATSLRRRRA